jgi:hypothetical protein
MLRVVLTTAFVVLLGAAPAHAAARTQAAQDFADAALRAHVAMRAQSDEITRRSRALRPRLCSSVLDATLRARRPDRYERGAAFMFFGLMRPLVDAILPVGRQLVADLDAVPTRDAALVEGREAWRELIALFEWYPVVDRPCRRLAAWRDSGWRRDLAPPNLIEEDQLLEDWDDAETFSVRASDAAARLRQLGVPRGAADRFAEDLIDVYEYRDSG